MPRGIYSRTKKRKVVRKRPMADTEVDFTVHQRAAALRTEQQIKEAVRNELKSPDFIEAVAMAMVQASTDILGAHRHESQPASPECIIANSNLRANDSCTIGSTPLAPKNSPPQPVPGTKDKSFSPKVAREVRLSEITFEALAFYNRLVDQLSDL